MATDQLSALLQKHFGFSEFREGQREAIEAILNHRAALAVFPTGRGKSLCYQLPALAIEGVTLVVSPLIALMKDQIDFLESRGIAAARLDSSLSGQEVREINDRLRSGELKLLYVAPERFNNERFLNDLHRLKIGLFAVDEAHCISEWGHNFRPDYLKLAQTAKEIGAERVLALTATATPKVVEDVSEAFAIPSEGIVVTGFYRSNLEMLTTPIQAERREATLLDRLKKRPMATTIVYVTLQKQAEDLAFFLAQHGYLVKAYHAGMSPEDRTNVQNWWKETPYAVVVATIAFGMGIDKSDVRYVYHAYMPKSLESYSQEIGRAGRDGKHSVVEMFACAKDIPMLENFVYGDTPTETSVQSLVNEILAQPEEFAVALYDMSIRHDIRQLVLRTALTYLELLGALRRGTPFYAGYEFRPIGLISDIGEAFPSGHGEFAMALFEVAKKGRIWYSLDPEVAAERLDVERKRVVRALEVMNERQLIELRSSDVRDRYFRLVGPEAAEGLVRELMARFEHREKAEIERLHMVPNLVQHEGCQVAALVGYFGERRTPCGHCTYCQSGHPQIIPAAPPGEPIDARIAPGEIEALREQYPNELATPRQVARFLCGLTSPWFTKSKLSRHTRFGVLDDISFRTVLETVARS